MLLEFRAKNYKSFKDELVFSLIPAPKQSGLDYSILTKEINNKKYKAICSSVIYGPNASGKTNIISAMDTLKSIVLRGHINNDSDANNPNTAANSLELIPNNTLKKASPVNFYIKFIEDNYLIEYFLKIDLGKFLDVAYDRKIIEEKLLINSKVIFSREKDLKIGPMKEIEDLWVNSLDKHYDGACAIAMNNLDPKELFLMNGFKTMFSSKLVNIITKWFESKFITVYRADSLQVIKKFNENIEKSKYVEKTLNEAASSFGINSNALGFFKDEESNEAKLCSIFKDQKIALPANIFESSGTIRFVNMFPLIINALTNGGILIVDEFDASIHSNVIMNIINIFHNDEININQAQLIFNTHNPIFLNSNLFRRDEIKFIERDEKSHCSIHYSLSDFETSSTKNGPGVRKGEDYLKNYFIDKYGAIRDVDFSEIIISALNLKKGDE